MRVVPMGCAPAAMSMPPPRTAKSRAVALGVVTEMLSALLSGTTTLSVALGVPPGNRLEKLTGNRVGQHSIRVNDQFRICFTWTAAGPTDVEIVDYHKG